LRIPVNFLVAENDAWVEAEDVRLAAARTPQGAFHLIKDAMHEVRENPAAAEQMFSQLVQLCVTRARGREPTGEALVAPGLDQLLRQNKIERKRLRVSTRDQETETEFWSRYLNKYEFFENVDAYHYYLDLVGGLLGRFEPGELVLDAGCGNGLFGVWVARHLLAKQAEPLDPPVIYVGLDLTHDGLADALVRQGRASAVSAATETIRRSLGFAYARVDLDRLGRVQPGPAGGPVLDFAPETFDKICCSLLLSYLEQPAELLRHLHRLLRPGGILVVSSMKPFCDLSEIYRRYVARHPSEREVASARALLGAAGRIKAREEQGIYTFFSAEELLEMLAAAGFRRCQAHPSFGRQANVVRAEK
jgi:SAM-dependent methyltransferase